MWKTHPPCFCVPHKSGPGNRGLSSLRCGVLQSVSAPRGLRSLAENRSGIPETARGVALACRRSPQTVIPQFRLHPRGTFLQWFPRIRNCISRQNRLGTLPLVGRQTMPLGPLPKRLHSQPLGSSLLVSMSQSVVATSSFGLFICTYRSARGSSGGWGIGWLGSSATQRAMASWFFGTCATAGSRTPNTRPNGIAYFPSYPPVPFS